MRIERFAPRQVPSDSRSALNTSTCSIQHPITHTYLDRRSSHPGIGRSTKRETKPRAEVPLRFEEHTTVYKSIIAREASHERRYEITNLRRSHHLDMNRISSAVSVRHWSVHS